MGVVGEEGAEIVARMKPASSSGQKDKVDQNLNIHVWDKRPQNLGPHDILLIVGNDMDWNGATGQGR